MAKGPADVEKLFTNEHTGSGALKKSTYKTTKMWVRPLSSDMALVDYEVEITGVVSPDGKAQPAMKPHVTSVMKKANGKWWIVSARAFEIIPPPPMPAAKK
jgi:ketosteroid isomerase-like protein